jgi:ribosomal-protein-serine acetyltransferase
VEGLVVRPWQDTDADAVALDDAVDASREHLRAFMVWATAPRMTTDERRAWFAEQAAGGTRLFGAWDGDALVGTVGLHPRIGSGGLEIGFWVHADHLRRGIATAMVARVCAIAFADPAVTHLEIRHDTANTPSGRVPAGLGFVRAGEAPGQAPRPPAATGTDLVWRLERAAGAPAGPSV